MAQGTFPIIEARQELGFTPSVSVKSSADLSTGDTGAAMGQALLAGAGALQRGSARKQAIEEKNRQNLDILSAREATALRTQRDLDIEKMKQETQPEKWEEETTRIATQFNTQIGLLDFSPLELAKQQITMQSDLETVPEESFIAASSVISKAAIQTAKDTLVEAFRIGDEDIANKELDFVEVMENNGVAASQILLDLKVSEEVGEELGKEDAINGVHGLIQAGNLEAAKVLVDSPEIPERDQTILRNKIKGVEGELLVASEEASRDLLGKELNSGTITYDKIDSSGLPETEQETYRLRMIAENARLAKGKPIETNQLVKGDIEGEAYNIWTGAVDFKNYKQTLVDARYGKTVDGKLKYVFGETVSDKPLINDGDYDELISLGTKELKTSQAKGLSESSFWTKGQLVELTSDVDLQKALDAVFGKKKDALRSAHQLQLENWSQFNHSMKLWQTENPDAIEADYYTESRRKMPFYKSRSDAEITGADEKEIRRQKYLRLKAKAKK